MSSKAGRERIRGSRADSSMERTMSCWIHSFLKDASFRLERGFNAFAKVSAEV